MKNKRIFIGLFLVLALALSFYKFNTYPKKVVANAIYSVEGRGMDIVDDYFDGLDISSLYYKIKSEGNMNLSLFIDKGIFYKEKWQYILTNDVSNKSKYLLKKYSGVNDYSEFHEESVINNEVYIEDSKFSPYVFYIDTNTMNSLSNNSTALGDMGVDINSPNLFSVPQSLSEHNHMLKKYVRDEWNGLLRSTKVRTISKGNYKIVLDSDKFKALMDKTFEFYKTRGDFSYEKIAEFFNSRKKKLDQDLLNRDELELFMEIDDEGNLKKVYSMDKDYLLDLDNNFWLILPDINIKLSTEENENYNTIFGSFNGREFRMSYYPITQKLIYHDDKNLKIHADFSEVNKGKSFKFSSKLKGTLYNRVDLRLSTKPDAIKKKRNSIEILKLDQKQWDELKKGMK
ncbi:hypothetical protein [Peptoniphilus sp.]|jgi:hypothetical protein|uniref:hypothetical protein n=1 Tax=Peptoniphilus sp. TaxID=1971214 RepID=UPI003D8AB237